MVETAVRSGIKRKHRAGVASWLHLVRVHSRIAQQERALLAAYGLTVAQFDVLSHLATVDGVSQTELASRLLVTKGNVGGLIDRLERDGLVERQHDPEDRRSYCLYLTDAGRQAFEAAAPELEALISEQFAALAPGEQREFLRLLARLDRSLGR